MWVFHFLEWTDSLLVARLNRATRGLLEPVLLQMTETAVRHATGVRGHREAWVSRHFPGFNIVRLWRLTGGYLKFSRAWLVAPDVGACCATSRRKRLTIQTCGRHAGRKSTPDSDLWNYHAVPYALRAYCS